MKMPEYKKYPLILLMLSRVIFGADANAESLAPIETRPSLCDEARRSQILARDGFSSGLKQWIIEQQDSHGQVSAKNGVLDIQQPAGATLWFRQKLKGDYVIEFSATPVPLIVKEGEPRISDLNMFWNATNARSKSHNPTTLSLDGALASYNPLQLYYLGFGANYNTTTRLRRYDGSEQRRQITGYATPESATGDDRAGAMIPATRLTPNEPVRIRIISRKPSVQQPENLLWYANDQLLFSFADPHPYLEGWFALRTTFSHFLIRDFIVYQCKSTNK